MTLDFTCQACDATFELELSEIIEDPTGVQCPSCEARAPRAAVEGVSSALDDLFAQLALLRRRFAIEMEIDSEDLPASYEQETLRSKDEETDEDEVDGWEGQDEEEPEEAGVEEDEDER
jgi:DNA-directed RNA polymerase subunit RPC12/RpoP